jgi:hypothetical protein
VAAASSTRNADKAPLSEDRGVGEGRGVARKHAYEAPEIGAFLRRMARAMVRRAAAGDLEAVSVLGEVHEAIGQAVAEAAREAHGFGYSWTEIGRELGITRQAARQRFAGEDERAE